MKKILAIDDDQDILYTLAAIGDMAGWTVQTTDSPKEALDMLDGAEFDSVIVDYHMPEMDGIALVRAIRHMNAHIPIVVLTVDDRMVLAERFRRAGANDFAVKPIKAPDFISRINLHLTSFRPKSTQSSIDIVATWENDPSALPKGLSAPTMSLIISILEDESLNEKSHLSADQIALRVGVAYQTVWRYLDVLESEDVVEVKFDYGSRGRPRKLYRLRT